jgi:signal transduction histidine kinase
LKALARRSALPVTLDVAIDADIPDAVEVAAYYVTAEALANAAKHAQASEVTVRARTVDETLYLSIRDNGIGGADSHKGSGINGLKDRVDVLRGKMTVNSPVGTGTIIDAAIPLAMPPGNFPRDRSPPRALMCSGSPALKHVSPGKITALGALVAGRMVVVARG